jgi:hypothetical protein
LVKEFSCGDQILSLAFAQITCRESLRYRGLSARLATQVVYWGSTEKYFATLASANLHCDWRINAGFAQVLISVARDLYANCRSVWSCPRPYLLWTPPPWIYAWRFFPEVNSAATKSP